MLKFFNANRKRSIEKLDFLLNQRKFKQLKQSSSVKKILANVKKMEIKL